MSNRERSALDHLVEELSKPEAEQAIRAMQHATQRRVDERRVENRVAHWLSAYFNEFVQKISSAETPTEALDMALSDLKTIGFFAPRIYRRNNGYCDLIRPAEESFSFDYTNPIYRHLFVEGNPFFIFNTSDPTLTEGVNNLTNDPSLRLPAEATESVGLRYSVPSLILQREIEGIVVVSYNPEHLFANANTESIGWRILSYVGNIVALQVKGLLDSKHHEKLIEEAQALAQEKDRLAKEKEHLAIHDPLTGMLNRYQMFNHLKEIWDAQAGSDICGAEVLFDSDRLKAINDAYGHDCGDEVLREVGGKVGLACKDHYKDSLVRITPYRYGGDEFVLALEGRVNQSVDYFADSVSDFARYLLNKMHQIEAVPEEFRPTSASLGVVITQYQRYANIGCEHPKKKNGGDSKKYFYTSDNEGWHKRTDDALYKAKEAGRDQARLYLPDGTERVIRP